MRLRKRGGVWHVRFTIDGVRYARTTKATTRAEATEAGRSIEAALRASSNPAADQVTLRDAVRHMLACVSSEVKAGRKAMATGEFYAQKTGNLLATLGEGYKLARLDAKRVRGYVETRRGHGASDHTISKELVALRMTLRHAIAAEMWVGDPKAVMPVGFAPEYKPRGRSLTTDELSKLLAELEPSEAARVAFIIATSAEWGAANRAERSHVAKGNASVHLLGTKRATRDRHVPIVAEWQRELLEYALAHAPAGGRLLFAPWPDVHQSLRWACKRAGIDYCTPNDLRRTFAQWMRRDGVPLELIAPMMGHATTTMLQLVYGKLDAETLAARVRATGHWPVFGPLQQVDGTKIATSVDVAKTDEGEENMRRTVVGRVGIEPTTNGLKVRLGSWSEPRKARDSHERGPIVARKLGPK